MQLSPGIFKCQRQQSNLLPSKPTDFSQQSQQVGRDAFFVCNAEKKITPSDCSDGNVSEFAVSAVYSSLIFMSSSDRKTH